MSGAQHIFPNVWFIMVLKLCWNLNSLLSERTKRTPRITKEKKSWELLLLVIGSFTVLGKVSIFQQGFVYCPRERPPIISRPIHCYSLGIDMIHKSELLDCKVLFLQPVTWPACQGPTSWWACIDLMLWGREQSGELTIISPWHTHTHPHTHTHTNTHIVHYAHPHIFQYSGMVYPISCTFFEALLLNSDTPLSPIYPPTLNCQLAVLS